MKHLVYAHQQNVALIRALYLWIHDLVAAVVVPRRERPHRVKHSMTWRSWVSLSVMLVSLVVQAVMLWMLGELIDLCISLMELWAELARKHLELTM